MATKLTQVKSDKPWIIQQSWYFPNHTNVHGMMVYNHKLKDPKPLPVYKKNKYYKDDEVDTDDLPF